MLFPKYTNNYIIFEQLGCEGILEQNFKTAVHNYVILHSMMDIGIFSKIVDIDESLPVHGLISELCPEV